MARAEPSARTILRIIALVVLTAVALYLVYLLRRPIGWVAMAAFIAIALGGPVNRLSRRIPRGIAITLVYLVLVLLPVALGALVIPPLVTQGTEFVEDNQRLRKLDQKYDITGELEKQAATLPGRIGDAAKILGDVGLGVVNSIFALLNILILSVFMVSRGRGWLDRALRLRPEVERERLSRVIDRTGRAVSGYVQGALTVALIAGVQTYLVLMILGVPFRAPLAVMAALFSLVPLVGATIAAVLIGIVTLFTHFPTATIVWAIWAVVYQQLENNLIQPQIQKRTVQVQPFIVLVAVLFGSTLLGVVGALVAIPLAATIQIVLREWWDYRREQRELLIVSPGEFPPPDDDGPTLVVPST
jgi:predicted PurR-regulated permease PerM